MNMQPRTPRDSNRDPVSLRLNAALGYIDEMVAMEMRSPDKQLEALEELIAHASACKEKLKKGMEKTDASKKQ